ncbi:GntR family transcriptional regulator [Clostridium intestinale]|uniref:GntR family transcriptional regulator n=2 Tax=Clostridium intestinale TaxID=36845 RepID=A0A7D6VQ19_9CLOT|nr:GntR family transcriptional regulator [Clostridium intestinale]QLY78157.1 GntR family transcriptional regulator [Clostridium intestinale]SHI41201.1 DNA-binding transcriptional regulator YhcF, GntR family [Clostridium intestinale DSM 6191]
MKFNESTPIYMQIIQKIKADIVSGRLKGGDKMPSVREFSENFKVNPNTVQRVFQELEREGITYSQRGIGTFIVDGDDILKELKDTQAQRYTERFVDEMKELGMNKEDISKYLLKVLEEKLNENS